MRYKPGHRDEAKARILVAIGRGFRRDGYGGIGVDGLASEAAVTSGAIYGHFASKEHAFAEALAAGLDELARGVEGFRTERGTRWIEPFVDFYLGPKRTCALADGCGLQTLAPDVTRAGDAVRAVYRDGMERVVDAIADGLSQRTAPERRGRAWALVSLLSGGVTLLRGLSDDEAIAVAIRGLKRAALEITGEA